MKLNIAFVAAAIAVGSIAQAAPIPDGILEARAPFKFKNPFKKKYGQYNAGESATAEYNENVSRAPSGNVSPAQSTPRTSTSDTPRYSETPRYTYSPRYASTPRETTPSRTPPRPSSPYNSGYGASAVQDEGYVPADARSYPPVTSHHFPWVQAPYVQQRQDLHYNTPATIRLPDGEQQRLETLRTYLAADEDGQFRQEAVWAQQAYDVALRPYLRLPPRW